MQGDWERRVGVDEELSESAGSGGDQGFSGFGI